MTEVYFCLLTIDNRLMADLTDPQPHLIHGIVDGDEWPNIRRGTTSSEIRVSSLNCMRPHLLSVQIRY